MQRKLIGLKSRSRFEAESELLVKQESGSGGDAGSAFFFLVDKGNFEAVKVITNRLKSGSRFETGSELLVRQGSGSEGNAGSAFLVSIKEILRQSMSLRT